MKRRNFLVNIFALLPLAAIGQTAIMEGDKAIACENGSITCPVCKKPTCKKIDAPLAVGNDSYSNPECVQLKDFHLLRCDICHVLFTRE